MDWMLTEEEIRIVRQGLGSDFFDAELEQAIAKAQARKLVEWLEQPCPCNIDMKLKRPYQVLRSECAVCEAILRKEVGLDTQ